MASEKNQSIRLNALDIARDTLKRGVTTREGVTLVDAGEYTTEDLIAEAKKIEAYLNE
jgi:hypothetical protein